MGDRLGIGDFAQRTGLSVSAVRFYGDRGLLAPAAVDPSSGYRSYDESQVGTGVLVRDLRRLGMTLLDVAAYLEADEEARATQLACHLDGLERRLEDARSVARSLTTRSEPTVMMTLPAADLCRALDQVLPAAGHDMERPVLTCVLVEAKDASLRLVATDSYRLVVRDLAPSGGTDASFRALVPATTLTRWRSSLPTTGEVSVGMDGSHFVVRVDDADVTAYAVDATYPAYESLLGADAGAATVIVDRATLLPALERFISGDDVVLLTASDGQLRIEKREEVVDLPARFDGPPTSVALRPDFAADAVRAAAGPDVVLEIAAPVKPVVFRTADDGTCTTMLMPVKLA